MNVTTVNNLPDFKRQLKNLDRKMRTRVIRLALFQAAKEFRDGVREEAPVRTGRLSRGVYAKNIFIRGAVGVEQQYSISIRQGRKFRSVGKKAINQDAYYFRFVVRGHLVRRPGGKIQGGQRARAAERSRLHGAGAKAVPPNPFVNRAFSRKGLEALRRFNSVLAAELDKAQRNL